MMFFSWPCQFCSLFQSKASNPLLNWLPTIACIPGFPPTVSFSTTTARTYLTRTSKPPANPPNQPSDCSLHPCTSRLRATVADGVVPWLAVSSMETFDWDALEHQELSQAAQPEAARWLELMIAYGCELGEGQLYQSMVPSSAKLHLYKSLSCEKSCAIHDSIAGLVQDPKQL